MFQRIVLRALGIGALIYAITADVPAGVSIVVPISCLFAAAETSSDSINEKDRKALEQKRVLSNPYRAGRSMVMGRHGMVASSHVLASQAGVDVLRGGGSAADAAVAAAAVLSVVEPMMTGPGGDAFVLYYEAKTGKIHGLNGSGRSPMGLTRGHFGTRTRIEFQGWEAVTVPGAVSAWVALQERFGAVSLDKVLGPAIRYAEDGYAVTEVVSSIWGGILQGDRWAKETWTIEGKAPKPGQLFRNPKLAQSLRLIAEGGHDAFYRGPIAKEIVRWSEESGGFFTMGDFESHRAIWVEPISTNYRGYEVYQCPPNSQGIGALVMLNILEDFDLASMAYNSAEYVHLLVEAKKLAYADLGKYVGDPENKAVPVEGLLSKAYAAERRKLLDPSRAMAAPEAGVPAGSDTVYLTVVDAEGNAASLVNSQYMAWGAGIGAGSMGFTLQNRGAEFNLAAGHVNEYAPGKRPFHTLMAGIVLRDGRLYMSYGLMGGDMQAQGHVQLLLGHFDHGLTIQEAAEAPRWRHTRDTVYVEYGMPLETVTGLRALGHEVVLGNAPLGGYGGAQIVLVDPATGTLFGASDPRKDGAALGY